MLAPCPLEGRFMDWLAIGAVAELLAAVVVMR
jgi:hypothetical protein